MIKKRSYFLGLTLLVLVVSSGFITFKEEKLEGFHFSNYDGIKYHVPNEYENDEILPIFIEKGFEFLEKETTELRSQPEDYCRYFKNTLFILRKK